MKYQYEPKISGIKRRGFVPVRIRLPSNQEDQYVHQISPRDLSTRGKAAALGRASRFDQLSVRLPRPDPATLGRAPRSRASLWLAFLIRVFGDHTILVSYASSHIHPHTTHQIYVAQKYSPIHLLSETLPSSRTHRSHSFLSSPL